MGARVKTIKDRMEKFGLGMLNEKQKKQYESLKKACELLKTEHESAQRKVKVGERQRGAKRRAGNVVIPRVTMRSEATSKFSMNEYSWSMNLLLRSS